MNNLSLLPVNVSPSKYSFSVKRTSSTINKINERINELLNINKEIHNKELLYKEFVRKIESKTYELHKRKEEIEIKEKSYVDRYKNLVETNEVLQDKLVEINKKNQSEELAENEELPRGVLLDINLMKEQINVKLNEVNLKQSEIEERKKNVEESFERLSEEDKNRYRNLEEEFLTKKKLEESSEENNQDFNFDHIMDELRESLSNLKKYKTISSGDKVFIDEGLALSKEEMKIAKITNFIQLEINGKEVMLGRVGDSESSIKRENNSRNLDNNNASQSHNRIRIIKENPSANNSSLILTIEDISQIHDIEILNNKDQLLTDELNINNHTPYCLTKVTEMPPLRTQIDKNALAHCISNKHLNHAESTGILLEGVRTNRSFFLLRQKRMQQMLNSSLEVYMDDIGGKHACCKLKRNYEANISLTNTKLHHLRTCSNERSSSLPNSHFNTTKRKLTTENKESGARVIREESEKKLTKENKTGNVNVVRYGKKDDPFVFKKSNKYSHIQSRLFSKNSQIEVIKFADNQKIVNTNVRKTPMNANNISQVSLCEIKEKRHIRTSSLTPNSDKKVTSMINSLNINKKTEHVSVSASSRSVTRTKK